MDKAHTLLVVDDNELNRDMLSRRLERRGFQVLVADDGGPALELMDQHEVDLVLLDIMMPGIDGLEVLRRIRAKWSENDLPVIMATAKAESENVVQALEIGANDYVVKPLDFEVVVARVEAQLRMRAGARAATAAARKAAPALGPSEIGPGAVLAGKYEIGERIGSGNFGAVHRARHLELEVDLAIKLLRPQLGHAEESLARFRLEGVSACRVQHPNAVTVYDFGVTDGGVAYLVMELLEGSSLADEMDRGPIELRRAAEILLPITHVLQEAHGAGIVHRDIKPENIFLHRTRRGEVVKVLDFGIAKLVGETVTTENLTTEGSVLGTPSYMAPDRLSDRVVDGKADVYSLGVMLFQMLSGDLPFASDSRDPMTIIMKHMKEPPPRLRSRVPELPAAVDALVDRTLAKRPEERPSAAELGRELAAAAGLELPEEMAATVLTGDRPKASSVGIRNEGSGSQNLDLNAPTVSLRRSKRAPGLLDRLRDFFS